jgi:hypothetical protein
MLILFITPQVPLKLPRKLPRKFDVGNIKAFPQPHLPDDKMFFCANGILGFVPQWE